MAENPNPGDDYLPVAEVEVDAVGPARNGFRLSGRGADSADYVLDVHFDMPVDGKTRTVLGELFSQSDWRIWRRMRQPLKPKYQSGARPGTPTR
jgi:hypothetical protein